MLRLPMRLSRLARTRFSMPEYVCTTNQPPGLDRSARRNSSSGSSSVGSTVSGATEPSVLSSVGTASGESDASWKASTASSAEPSGSWDSRTVSDKVSGGCCSVTMVASSSIDCDEDMASAEDAEHRPAEGQVEDGHDGDHHRDEH